MPASITSITVTLRGQVGTNIVGLTVTAPSGAVTALTLAADRTWSHQVSAGAGPDVYLFTTTDDAGRTLTRTVTVETPPGPPAVPV